MMLVEVTQVPQAALPVDEFKEHLRLGTGFSDDDVQNALLESHLRAALAAIEARTGKILIARPFQWTLSAWRQASGQVLPVSPVTQVDAVVMLGRDGVEAPLDGADYYLIPDTQRPVLSPVAAWLPDVPKGGVVRITMTAGYGAAWADIPRDLAQAVMMLAAHFYEMRFAGERQPAMPEAVLSLIEGYRNLRLFMGGAHG